jgi:hypothetical protein
MEREMKNRQDNYMAQLLKLAREGHFAPGEVHAIEVHHAGWCGFPRGKRCNCNPELSLDGQRITPPAERN